MYVPLSAALASSMTSTSGGLPGIEEERAPLEVLGEGERRDASEEATSETVQVVDPPPGARRGRHEPDQGVGPQIGTGKVELEERV
jgi:hypothetical protein